MADCYPKVEINAIKNLGVATKKGGVKISFETESLTPDLLKLMYLSAEGQPMNAKFESPQATLDLKLETINVKTGVIEDA